VVHDIYQAKDRITAKTEVERMDLNLERFYRLGGYLSWLALALAIIAVSFATTRKRASLLVAALFTVLFAIASLLAQIRV